MIKLGLFDKFLFEIIYVKGFFMNNITPTSLFSNYYNLAKNKVNSLSSLQKKVAFVALLYFSCVTVGYLFYRCYHHFTPQKIGEKE